MRRRSHPHVKSDDSGNTDDDEAARQEQQQSRKEDDKGESDQKLRNAHVQYSTNSVLQVQRLAWALVTFVAILVAIALIAQKWRHKVGITESILSQVANKPVHGGLDHILHPERHVNREPKTHYHHWTVTSAYQSPDGVTKRVYLVNGQFPGPAIEARSGDTVVIDVHNGLDKPAELEGLALHWHGLEMRGANHMDGAVGITQCPIPPGRNFTYEFKIGEHEHGTFWWHSHDQVQRADGLFGALIVHDPSEHILDREIEERLLLVGDWYHRSAKDVMAWYMRSASFGNEPVPDSILLNGLGDYDCSMAVPARPVECTRQSLPAIQLDLTKTYRFRVVNTGTLAGFSLSVPGASLSVLEIDGGNRVESVPSSTIETIYPGERVDFILGGPSATIDDSIELQIELDRENFRYPNPALNTTHTFPINISGNKAKSRYSNIQEQSQPQPFSLRSAIAVHRPEMPSIPPVANEILLLYTNTVKKAHRANVPHGYMNQTSWKPQEDPPLPLIAIPRTQWDKHQFVPQMTAGVNGSSSAYWVDIIINNLDDGSHPFHLHGHSFYVLAVAKPSTYWGSYNPYVDPEPPEATLNVENPMRKDTVNVPARGYAVLRFLADNFGIHMLHCHIMWHQAAGMAMALQVGYGSGLDELQVDESVLSTVVDLCKA